MIFIADLSSWLYPFCIFKDIMKIIQGMDNQVKKCLFITVICVQILSFTSYMQMTNRYERRVHSIVCKQKTNELIKDSSPTKRVRTFHLFLFRSPVYLSRPFSPGTFRNVGSRKIIQQIAMLGQHVYVWLLFCSYDRSW